MAGGAAVHASLQHNYLKSVSQELKDRLRFSKLHSAAHPADTAYAQLVDTSDNEETQEEMLLTSYHAPEDDLQAEVQDLQQQLDQARLVISQLAGQADHDKGLQKALAAQLTAQQSEAASRKHASRLYHQAMDECQRLQSENIALRQMLQQELSRESVAKKGNSSRGRSQSQTTREAVATALQPGMSFVAHRVSSSSRSASPHLSSFIRTGGGYAPLEIEPGRIEALQPDPIDGCQHPSFGSNQQHTPKPGSWIPGEVVQLVIRFVRHLSCDISWTDIQQLLVLIDQIYAGKASDKTRDLQQQHNQCAHTLRRRAANAEPYMQVRDKQAIAHLKAQLAQTQGHRNSSGVKGGSREGSNGISRKAQAHVHMAMEKCLHMDREIDSIACENQALKRNMGVYIAEAQRAKHALQQHMQAAEQQRHQPLDLQYDGQHHQQQQQQQQLEAVQNLHSVQQQQQQKLPPVQQQHHQPQSVQPQPHRQQQRQQHQQQHFVQQQYHQQQQQDSSEREHRPEEESAEAKPVTSTQSSPAHAAVQLSPYSGSCHMSAPASAVLCDSHPYQGPLSYPAAQTTSLPVQGRYSQHVSTDMQPQPCHEVNRNLGLATDSQGFSTVSALCALRPGQCSDTAHLQLYDAKCQPVSGSADDNRRVTNASNHAASNDGVPPQQGTTELYSTAYAADVPPSCGIGHVAGQHIGGNAARLVPTRLFTDAVTEVDRIQLCTGKLLLTGQLMEADKVYLADTGAWGPRGHASPNATRLTFARCALLISNAIVDVRLHMALDT